MRIVVQKFGGTSVVTPAARRNVTARIREALAEGLHVVAVVSAMG
ncbi:MAG: aspartate kinase, partial [Bacillota bacterium]